MTIFCVKPNSVLPICNVKMLKLLFVGARFNTGNNRMDLSKEKTTSYLYFLYTYNLMKQRRLTSNYVDLSSTSVKLVGGNIDLD